MSSDQYNDDNDYTSEYADDIILKPENNLMCRMIFFERKMIFDNEGKITSTKRRIKFEVRVPMEAIATLMKNVFRMRESTKTVPELTKKPTNEELQSLSRYSEKYFTKNYDDEVSYGDVTDAKFNYINKVLGHWYDFK